MWNAAGIIGVGEFKEGRVTAGAVKLWGWGEGAEEASESGEGGGCLL